MDDGVCYASQETLAQYLNISAKSVSRHMKLLVENGYLQVVKTEKGKPNIYKDTGRAQINIDVSASDTPVLYYESEDRKSYTPDRESDDLGQRVRRPRTESPLNKTINKTFNKHTDLAGLSDVFSQQSGILAYKMDKWIESLSNIKNMGGDEQIIQMAVKQLSDAGMQLTGPWSIEKTVAGLVGKRRRGNGVTKNEDGSWNV
jgi:DNA-binding transcriptional MocR family regulator